MILLNRLNLEERMNRWYCVSVQSSLFEDHVVILGWGSRESDFQQWRIISALSLEQAQKFAERVVGQKLRKGYRIV